MVLYQWARAMWQTLSVTEKESLMRSSTYATSHITQLLSGQRSILRSPVYLEMEEFALLHKWSTQILHKHKDPFEMESFLSKEHMYGLEIPKSFGGLGATPYFHSKILTKMASIDRSGRWIHQLMVPNSLGPAQLLLRYGTTQQCHELLHDISNGQKIPCFGLTGPWNGSDAAAMPISGQIEIRNGQEGILFSCEKRWITLAPIATLLGLAIRVKDHGICLLLIDRSKLTQTENETISIQWHHPIGSSFPNGHIRIKDLWVPLSESVIGGKEGLNQGWKMLMECLRHGRGISLPSVSLGSTACIVHKTLWYSLVRQQFKRPLFSIYGVQTIVTENILLWTCMKALNEYYHALLQQGEQSSSFSAFMKWIMTDFHRTIVSNSMDIFAGKGITLGSKNPIVHYYLQNPIGITVEGSNTLSEHLIVPVQTLMEHHPHFSRLVAALERNDPKQFYEQIGKWTLDLVRHFPFIMVSNTSYLIWKQFYLLCQGSSLRTRQDLTKPFAHEIAHYYLTHAIQWYGKHHPWLKSIETPLLQYIKHRILSQTKGIPSSWDRNQIQTLSETLLRNPEARLLLEEDLILDPQDPYSQVRDLWSSGKYLSIESFSHQLPQELIQSIIEVDSYSFPPP